MKRILELQRMNLDSKKSAENGLIVVSATSCLANSC